MGKFAELRWQGRKATKSTRPRSRQSGGSPSFQKNSFGPAKREPTSTHPIRERSSQAFLRLLAAGAERPAGSFAPALAKVPFAPANDACPQQTMPSHPPDRARRKSPRRLLPPPRTRHQRRYRDRCRLRTTDRHTVGHNIGVSPSRPSSSL